MKHQKGFTLIELLVVISIIGVLSSVVMVSLNDVRTKARDTVRKNDLKQISVALESYYYSGDETYIIPGTGWNGCSCGWFNYESGAYAKSIARGLEELGYFTKAPDDPLGFSSGYRYMKYQCGQGFYVYAKLEDPSPADLATYNNAACRPGYGMNYAMGHSD